MRITTQGSYGLVCVLTIARNADRHPVSIQTISKKEQLSIDYLEQLLLKLRRAGIVKSLTRPGGSLTGIQVRGSTPKALEHMLSASPGMKNVVVPVSFDTKAANQSREDLRAAAEKLDIKVTVQPDGRVKISGTIPEEVQLTYAMS